MGPRTHDGEWRGYKRTVSPLVTDEESSDEGEDEHARGQVNQTSAQQRIQKLPWMGPRGNVLPRVGQQCLVMVGDSGRDIGQVGQVTGVKAVMMEIAYRHGPSGQVRRKHKRPSSVILLEDGLELAQNLDGTVWVRQVK